MLQKRTVYILDFIEGVPDEVLGEAPVNEWI